MTTNRLSLPELATTQAQKEVVHNAAIAVLDAWTQATVLDIVNSPPGGEIKGNAYLVGVGTGVFLNKNNNLAIYNGSTWEFYTPLAGFTVWNEDAGTDYRYTGSTWEVATVTSGGPFILSLSSPGTLSSNQLLLSHVFAYTTTFPASLTGSYAYAGSVATSDVTLTIYKRTSPYASATTIGNIVYGTGDKLGTFTFNSQQVFSPSDVIEIYALGSPDTTLGDLAITLLGSRG